MKSYNIKHIIYFLYFLQVLYIQINSQIFIPFHINENELDARSIRLSEFLDTQVEKTLYTEISIGTNNQKLTAILTQNSHNMLIYHNTKFPKANSNYVKESSKTYFNDLNSPFKSESDSKLLKHIKESLTFYKTPDLKETVTVNDLYLGYLESGTEIEEANTTNLCMNIGFKLTHNYQNSQSSIIFQLKQKGLINNYNFFFNFKPSYSKIDGIYYDGYLAIGTEPHLIMHNKFDNNNYLKVKAEVKDAELSWDIKLDKIFYYIDNKEVGEVNIKDLTNHCIYSVNKVKKGNNTEVNEILVDNGVYSYDQGTINTNLGIIKGTNSYSFTIKKYFFDNYISKGICYYSAQTTFSCFYCRKESFSLKDRQSFPPLYFTNSVLNYTFVLDYKDLFVEIDDYVYFLVVFDEQIGELNDWMIGPRWELGQLFLSKYMLTFDYDKKLIGFYNSNLGNYSQNKRNISFVKILLIILLLTVFAFCGYYLAKYLYHKAIRIDFVKELENDDIFSDANSSSTKYSNVGDNKLSLDLRKEKKTKFSQELSTNLKM